MMRRLVLSCLLAAVPAALAFAQAVPVPRPFPGAPAPPAGAPTTPAPTPQPVTPPPAAPVAPDAAAMPQPAAAPELEGVPIYPTADYLETIDAGAGQSYHLYGTDAPFSDIVAYYRTVLRDGGREIYRTPGTHQFELGRFDDNRMVYPPSVVVKDYAGEAPGGYLHVDGTAERRYPTLIQIVPPPPGRR